MQSLTSLSEIRLILILDNEAGTCRYAYLTTFSATTPFSQDGINDAV
jgi:hypothetical protein